MDTQHLEQLISQRSTLETFLQKQNQNPANSLPAGLRITLNIYTQILMDGIAILDTIISHAPEPSNRGS